MLSAALALEKLLSVLRHQCTAALGIVVLLFGVFHSERLVAAELFDGRETFSGFGQLCCLGVQCLLQLRSLGRLVGLQHVDSALECRHLLETFVEL